jgi:CubicO group peptidase (beta-lactamase class C family)
VRPLEQVDGWEPTIAVAVVRPRGVRASRGPTDEPFRWASLTKPVYAYAVLTLVDEGTLRLDEPAGPEGSTLRHLLAHTSGLPGLGSTVTTSPEKRRVYSNEGYEALGQHVADRAGLEPAALVRERVLHPLGMGATELGDRSPAQGLVGPLDDLARFATELLAPTLLPDELFTAATTTQFAGLAGVLPGFGRHEDNAWGLGFEVRDGKQPHWTGKLNSPRTFGHFGGSGSFLWVDPEVELACVELASMSFDEWPAAERWPVLSDAILAAYA